MRHLPNSRFSGTFALVAAVLFVAQCAAAPGDWELVTPNMQSTTKGDGPEIFRARDLAPGIVTRFNGKETMVLMGGTPGTRALANCDVWTSENAKDWTSMSFHFPCSPYSPIVNVGDHFCLYGHGFAFGTKDFVKWQFLSKTPFAVLNFATQDGEKLLGLTVGNKDGYIWKSNDGQKWVPLIPKEKYGFWGQRSPLAFVFHDSKYWLIGGEQDGQLFNDVWYSHDGSEWIQATSKGKQWKPRKWSGSIVHDNKIWIICGYDGKKDVADVWSLDTGKGNTTWIELAGKKMPPRHAPTCYIFQKTIFVVSGKEGDSGMSRSVYKLAIK